jgi:flagellar basal body-associated protein FliL
MLSTAQPFLREVSQAFSQRVTVVMIIIIIVITIGQYFIYIAIFLLPFHLVLF